MGAALWGSQGAAPHQPLEAQGRQPHLAASDKAEKLQAPPSPQAPPGAGLGDPWEAPSDGREGLQAPPSP